MKTINTKQKSLPTSYGTKREEKVCFSMNVKKGISKGFTLVELIIVITILAILATIAFISFKNYSGNARDGNRIATLKTIETGIELYTLKTGTPPSPEGEMIQIMGSGTTASGTLLWTKGKLGETISKQIKMNKTPFDPYTQTAYIYASTPNGEYQIGTTLENFQATIFTPVAYANQSQAKVVGNYKARFFETETMRYFIPSLIFTGTGINGEIRLFDTPSPTLYYVTDRDSNLPYPLGTTVSENKEMNDLELVKDIIEKVRDQLEDDGDKEKVKDYFTNSGILKTEEDLIYKTIKETTGSASSSPPPTNSCAQEPSYTNASFTPGNPTQVNQAWQSTDATAACYRTCSEGYTGTNCEPLGPDLSLATITEGICISAGWGWVPSSEDTQGNGFCISPRMLSFSASAISGGVSWNGYGANYNGWSHTRTEGGSGTDGATGLLPDYECTALGSATTDFDNTNGNEDTLHNRMKWMSANLINTQVGSISWITGTFKPASHLSIPAIIVADCIDGVRDLGKGKPDLGGISWTKYTSTTNDTTTRDNRNTYLQAWTQQSSSERANSHLPSAYSEYSSTGSYNSTYYSSTHTGEYQVACKYFTGSGASLPGATNTSFASDDSGNKWIWLASIGSKSGSFWGYTARILGADGCASQLYEYAGNRHSTMSARFVVR